MSVKVSAVKPGSVLIVDGGFTCIRSGSILTVQEDDNNALYIPCARGRHYLDGQLYNKGTEYIGLSPS